MIKITEIDEHYYRCSACSGEEDIRVISFGINNTSVTTFRLCKGCRKELINELIEQDDAE